MRNVKWLAVTALAVLSAALILAVLYTVGLVPQGLPLTVGVVGVGLAALARDE